MRFKYRKSMRLPRRRQEQIYCICQAVKVLPEEERQRIRQACDNTGIGNAVYEYITTDASSLYVSQRYYVSEKWLAVKMAEVFRELSKIY